MENELCSVPDGWKLVREGNVQSGDQFSEDQGKAWWPVPEAYFVSVRIPVAHFSAVIRKQEISPTGV
jgi:hypothetical protein